jgi:ParB-like chromosome segregation protein Spo0J
MAYKGSLGPVERSGAAKDRKRLVQLDAGGTAPEPFGKGLALADIHQCPSLFQPRGDSLNYAPGRSAEHIDDLTRGLRRGEALEPVTVVSFGPHWYLVDGHHRIEAYRQAKWRKLIPAKAETGEATGAARVAWAVDLSTAGNRNNKLAMSTRDKADAAWRRLVAAEGQRGAAAETVRATGVSERTVATMAKTLRTLGELGSRIPDTWSAAQREAAGDRDGATGDYAERRERELLKRLQPVMEHRPSPRELVEALHAFDPALCRDLYTALNSDGWNEGVEEELDL